MLAVEAVDPGIHFGRVNNTTGGDVSASYSDSLAFPCKAVPALCFGLRAEGVGAISRRWSGIHAGIVVHRPDCCQRCRPTSPALPKHPISADSWGIFGSSANA